MTRGDIDSERFAADRLTRLRDAAGNGRKTVVEMIAVIRLGPNSVSRGQKRGAAFHDNQSPICGPGERFRIER